MDTIGGGEVSLGDLADLTVTNDNDLSCDVSSRGAPPLTTPVEHPAQCQRFLVLTVCTACAQSLTHEDKGCRCRQVEGLHRVPKVQGLEDSVS